MSVCVFWVCVCMCMCVCVRMMCMRVYAYQGEKANRDMLANLAKQHVGFEEKIMSSRASCLASSLSTDRPDN